MVANKGKVNTKGSKQIKEENGQTYNLYTKIILGSYVPTIVFQFLMNFNDVNWVHWFLLAFPSLVYFLIMATLKTMVTSGLDLNAEAGVSEHLKDILGITAVCLVLSCFSLKFWVLWLVIPTVALVKLWRGIISPWIFQEGPPEMTDKQKKKMERKTNKRF